MHSRQPEREERHPRQGGSTPYLDEVLAQVPRVLGRLDRERFSPTFGCLDRTYWAWKFTDFPGARFQEGVCALAYLFTAPFEANPYRGRTALLEWIAGGIDFWTRIQRRGGDFDEAYPYERSLAATAFTAFYLSEAHEFLGDALPAATRGRLRDTLAAAGGWLCRNDETHGFLSNHLAAAAAALHHAYRILGEERFERRCQYFLSRILEHQSTEGWYDEYGGADPGYQTHGSFYLARLHALGASTELAASLERSFRFLAHFVHPDRSLGGEYASRNTQTYYPAAFEMMARESASARWIAREMLPAVESGSAAGLRGVDAYNLFPLLNNYVFAHVAAARDTSGGEAPAPGPEIGEIHFPEAGLLKVRRTSYDAIVGLHKGGVVKVFDRRGRRLVLSSCGYIGALDGGALVSNQWSDPDRPIRVSADRVTVEGSFYRLSRPVMEPFRFVAFRLFSLTLGRVGPAARWVKSLLVRVLIYRKKEVPLRFRRTIEFGPDHVEVLDRLEGALGAHLRSLVHGDTFTTIHMGSARYFVPHELDSGSDPLPPADLASGLERRMRVELDS